MLMPDVIVIGDINVDLILNLSAYPAPGGEAVASSVQMHTGGSAVNTAIALARMNLDVGFIGRIGRDPLAKQVLVDLQDAGVDCEYIQTDTIVNTGMIVIAVTADGERTMFSARGANVYTDASAIDPQYLADCRWLHISGYTFLSHHQHETAMMALDTVKRTANAKISFDIGIEPATQARSQILKTLPKIDVIFPNELELLLLSQGRPLEEALDYLADQMPTKAVVAKLGSKGSILAIDNRKMVLPPFRVRVKDTTGAGDSFNAGVVFGQIKNFSWDASVALGNALGGLATTEEGGGTETVSPQAVFKLVESHLFREKWLPARYALEEIANHLEELL